MTNKLVSLYFGSNGDMKDFFVFLCVFFFFSENLKSQLCTHVALEFQFTLSVQLKEVWWKLRHGAHAS